MEWKQITTVPSVCVLYVSFRHVGRHWVDPPRTLIIIYQIMSLCKCDRKEGPNTCMSKLCRASIGNHFCSVISRHPVDPIHSNCCALQWHCNGMNFSTSYYLYRSTRVVYECLFPYSRAIVGADGILSIGPVQLVQRMSVHTTGISNP